MQVNQRSVILKLLVYVILQQSLAYNFWHVEFGRMWSDWTDEKSFLKLLLWEGYHIFADRFYAILTGKFLGENEEATNKKGKLQIKPNVIQRYNQSKNRYDCLNHW